MRLIDADALYETAKNIWDHADSEDFEKEIFIAIATAPTIEERKKGKWIPKPDIYLDEQTWECSECGEPWIFIEGTPSENRAHFCPNCGADMRGKQDDSF